MLWEYEHYPLKVSLSHFVILLTRWVDITTKNRRAWLPFRLYALTTALPVEVLFSLPKCAASAGSVELLRVNADVTSDNSHRILQITCSSFLNHALKMFNLFHLQLIVHSQQKSCPINLKSFAFSIQTKTDLFFFIIILLSCMSLKCYLVIHS